MYLKLKSIINKNNSDIYFISAIFFISLLSKFLLLDARSIHHDESLHAYYSWAYSNGNGFTHNPLMHGPLLFHLNALLFFIFGDSDYISRVVPAIFGCILTFTPMLFIKFIGKRAAFFSSFIILLSPTILYYSRFARNDIIIATITLLLVYSLFSYVYASKRNNYLFIFSLLLSLGFCIKETHYMTVFFIGVFSFAISHLNFLVKPKNNKVSEKFSDIFVLIFALTIPLASPLIGIIGNLFNLNMIPGASESSRIGYPSDNISLVVSYVAIFITFFISFSVGIYWFKKKWIVLFSVFWIVFITFFSSLGSNPDGIYTGIWQSLGYWIAQQDVARGSQPWFYFFLVIFSYEFLLIFISISSIIFLRKKLRVFEVFLIIWFLFNMLIYGIASEKMPWLSVNIILPLLLYSGITISEITKNISKINIYSYLKYLLFIGYFALIFSLFLNSTALNTLILSFITSWFLILIIFNKLKNLTSNKPKIIDLAKVIYGLILVILIIFTLKISINSSFYNSDIPDEIIVYTQTSPNVHNLVKEIENYKLINNTASIAVDISGGYQWPWAWYLRHHDVIYFDSTNEETMKDKDFDKFDYIIVNSRNFLKFNSNVTSSDLYENLNQVPFRMWFPEDYRFNSLNEFMEYSFNINNINYLMRHVIFKDFSGEIGTVDMTVIRK
ncbi:MAG: hypothetical protein CL762_04110 [Chloroflexi bacterium]|nr:hypothetical protein [Chloroflexota bacterium]